MTEPQFPAAGAADGLYESFYVRAGHPTEPLAVWIRYTVHKPPGAPPRGSLWFTLFDRRAGRPRASKVTLEPGELAGGDGSWIRIGDSSFAPGRLAGRASSEQLDAAWDLAYVDCEPPFRHLPRDWMYTAPVPRTKLESPSPAAVFRGRVTAGEREIELDGWVGMVGHNWGAEHAERWIWIHGGAFEGHPGAWLDLAVGRVKVGGLTLPWIANGCLSVGEARHRLGGIGRTRATRISERRDRCDFVVPGAGVRLTGSVSAGASDFVGWRYADPDGGEHTVVNCSAAAMELTLERRDGSRLSLATDAGAAYELGTREPGDVQVEPFPDG